MKSDQAILMNDSNEYVPSIDDSISSKNKKEEIKASKKLRNSVNVKKKSSKLFKENLYAIPSKAGNDSEMLKSSVVNNSVYIDNQSEYGNNEYS